MAPQAVIMERIKRKVIIFKTFKVQMTRIDHMSEVDVEKCLQPI